MFQVWWKWVKLCKVIWVSFTILFTDLIWFRTELPFSAIDQTDFIFIFRSCQNIEIQIEHLTSIPVSGFQFRCRNVQPFCKAQIQSWRLKKYIFKDQFAYKVQDEKWLALKIGSIKVKRLKFYFNLELHWIMRQCYHNVRHKWCWNHVTFRLKCLIKLCCIIH